MGSERPESQDRVGISYTRDGVDFLVHKVTNVLAILNIAFRDQIPIATGRVDFGRDMRVGEVGGNIVGPPQLAFDVHKKALHRSVVSRFVPVFQRVRDILTANFQPDGGVMFEKFGKWLFGLVLTALILMYGLPLLGINPDTKRFYSDEEADMERYLAKQRARSDALKRAQTRQKSQ